MDLQTLIALGIVAACGIYLVRRWVRSWTGKAPMGCHSGGCGGCAQRAGCAAQTASPSPEKRPLEIRV
jgi:hypothetical protein